MHYLIASFHFGTSAYKRRTDCVARVFALLLELINLCGRPFEQITPDAVLLLRRRAGSQASVTSAFKATWRIQKRAHPRREVYENLL